MPDWRKILRTKLKSLALTPEREAEVIEELAQDLEASWSAAVAAGADEQAAMAAALEELGDDSLLDHHIAHAVAPSFVGAVLEACNREERNAPFGTPESSRKVQDLMQDLHHAVHMTLKSPGFAAVIIMILALGIGANTAIFSVVNGVLLKPLPYRDPGRLVMVWAKNPKGIPRNQVSTPNFADWKSRNRAFEDMAAFTGRDFTLTGLGEPEKLAGADISPNLFPLLGIGPAIGRNFQSDEGRTGGAQAVILSNGLWQRRFGGDPGVLGRSVTLNGLPQLVVGVMSRNDSFLVQGIDIWVASEFGDFRDNRAANLLQVVARLKHGRTQDEAQAEMDVIAARLSDEYPKTNEGWGATVISLREQITGEAGPSLLILLGIVGLVLLIACANVANLLLARVLSRQKEVAVRAALGASRGRIFRQLLSEGLFFSILSGSLGVLVASMGIDFLLKLKPENLPRSSDIGIDLTVLVFTLLATLLTGVVFGLAPAVHALSIDLNLELKQSGRQVGEAGRALTLRRALLIGEVALAVILLNGEGLLIQSFLKLTNVNPGFQAKNVLAMDIALPSSKYQTASRQAEFFDDLLQRLQKMQGVDSAAAVFPAPLAGGVGFLRFGYKIEGRATPAAGQSDRIYVRWVSPEYFQTMGIPLHAGRSIGSRDGADSPLVVVIDETLVRRDFADEDPIGKQVMTSFGPRVWRRIVGVVGGVHQTALDTDAGPHVYLPYSQMPLSGMTVVVKTHFEPRALTGTVKAQVFGVDPDQPVSRLAPMEERLVRSVSFRRFTMWLVGLFAVLALLITAVGVYSVMLHSVSRRTQEMGVRMALGAKPSDIYRLVIGEGMSVVMVGVGIGAVGALGLTRLLTVLLYGVRPQDPPAMLASCVVLAAVGIVACYWPARRATRVDPTQAMRSE